MTVVLDPSFVSRALIPSQRLPGAVELLAQLQRSDRVISTPTMAIEFGSAIRRLEFRGILTDRERRNQWSTFEELGIEFVWDQRWVERAMEIATNARLSKIYDSLYLACAEAFHFELVTCDGKFARAVRELGVAPVRLIDT